MITAPTYVSSLLHGLLLLDKIPSVESDRQKPVLGGKGRGGRRRRTYSHDWEIRAQLDLKIRTLPSDLCLSLLPSACLHSPHGNRMASGSSKPIPASQVMIPSPKRDPLSGSIRLPYPLRKFWLPRVESCDSP